MNAPKVIVAGSFCTLHRGHIKLLKRAGELAQQGKLYVGLSSDSFVRIGQKSYCPNYEYRKKKIEQALKDICSNFEIIPIEDIYGFSLNEDFDFIVVSEETEVNAKKINEERSRRGLKNISIEVVELELAEDLMPISSRRISEGIIDEDGKRLREVVINVGSRNPVKINAVKNVFSNYIKNFRINGIEVGSGVKSQPTSREEIMKGAFNRAINALGEGDYGIGIEAGVIFYEKFDIFIDVQYCFIVDCQGRVSFGHGSGFAYPQSFNEEIRKGREVGEIMAEVSGIENIGKSIGAIGYLTRGVLSREYLTEQSVLSALIPRLNSGLYRFWSSSLWTLENIRKILI